MTDSPDQSGLPDRPGSDRDADAVAVRVLDKLRVFISGLDDDERAVLAALLAPGVAGAYHDEPEVVGFSAEVGDGDRGPALGWQPQRLSDSLAAQVRNEGLRIEFDEPS